MKKKKDVYKEKTKVKRRRKLEKPNMYRTGIEMETHTQKRRIVDGGTEFRISHAWHHGCSIAGAA